MSPGKQDSTVGPAPLALPPVARDQAGGWAASRVRRCRSRSGSSRRNRGARPQAAELPWVRVEKDLVGRRARASPGRRSRSEAEPLVLTRDRDPSFGAALSGLLSARLGQDGRRPTRPLDVRETVAGVAVEAFPYRFQTRASATGCKKALSRKGLYPGPFSKRTAGIEPATLSLGS